MNQSQVSIHYLFPRWYYFQQQSTFPVYIIQLISTVSSFTLIYNYYQHPNFKSHLSRFQVKKIIILNSKFQFFSSSFAYNQEKVIFLLNNIDYIINYKYSIRDIYTMD